MTRKIIGWDQIYHLESRNIRKPSDRIIVLVHWNLIINNSFKCLGLGNEKYTTELDKELLSELLPDGWNISSHYNIRYIYNDSVFILIGIEISSDLFFIYLLHPNSEVLTSITLKISDTVILKSTGTKIPNLFNNYEILLKIIQTDLVDMVLMQSDKLKKETPVIVKKDDRKMSNSITLQYWPTNYLDIIRDDFFIDDYTNWNMELE